MKGVTTGLQVTVMVSSSVSIRNGVDVNVNLGGGIERCIWYSVTLQNVRFPVCSGFVHVSCVKG